MLARLMVVAVAVGIWMPAAMAQATLFSINQDCSKLKATVDHDGIICMVGDDRILRINVLAKATDAQPRKDRAQYNVGVVSRNFYAAGGRTVLVRSTNKEGEAIQRSCTRGTCGDWYMLADKK